MREEKPMVRESSKNLGETLKGGETQREGPKKRKDSRGNNPQQEISKKLRLCLNWVKTVSGNHFS